MTITIKGLPGDVHRRLKERARSHGRSLNREVIASLQQAVAAEPLDAEALIERARRLRARVHGTFDDEAIRRARRAGRP